MCYFKKYFIGNKPDFHAAMNAEGAKNLYEEFLKKMR